MEHIKHKTRQQDVEVFYGLEDWMNIRPHSAVNGPYRPHGEALARADNKTGRYAKGWFGPGIENLGHLKQVAREGWSYGLKRVTEAVGSVGGDIVPVSLKRRIVRGDTGDNYDIHRAMCGGLDRAWDSRKRQKRVAGGAKLTIAVAVGQASGVGASVGFWRGAAAIRLADLFTEAGYQVQVVAYSSKTDTFVTGNKHSLTLVEAKAASAPLDLVALTTLVALTGVYRHFGLWQHHANENQVDSGHGAQESNAQLLGVDINIPYGSINDRTDCERFIRNTVAMYGMDQAA